MKTFFITSGPGVFNSLMCFLLTEDFSSEFVATVRGKHLEKLFFQVREKSGNFVIGWEI